MCSDERQSDLLFYNGGQHPEYLLINGNYSKLPLMYGAK